MTASTPQIAGRVRAALGRSPAVADAVLVTVLAVLGIVSEIVLVAPAMGPAAPPAPVIVLWAVGFCLPLLLRRRFPCTVLAVCAVHYWLFWATGQRQEIMTHLVVGVAAFAVGALAGRRRTAWCAAAVAALTAAMVVLAAVLGLVTSGEAAVLTVLNLIPFLVGGSLGIMTRRLRDYRAELEDRNAELARSRRADEQRAVLEERVRIARELHDVVAHHVVLMGIRAGVAHRLFDDRPDEARAAVVDVQAGGRQAVAELQRTIGVLRSEPVPGSDGPDEPSPGLARLPSLVEQVRRAGLPVELTVADVDVDDGLGLSAYRIVQEALTNTLKHAGPARAVVDVRCGGDGVEIEVLDDGRGDGRGAGSGGSGGGGRGLVGIRERVAMHGGRLEAGPRDGGGYRVHATLGLR